MKKQIDAPIAQLVLDLEERGLLDRTLIVLASEFSRDMLIEGKPDQQGEGPGRGARHDHRARSTTACTGTSPTPAACCCSAAA